MEDDLLDLLGVTLPGPKAKSEVGCGAKPPRQAPKRFVEWSDATAFVFGGYVARVTQTGCETCDEVTEVLDGVFVEELHRSGTRRLTALGAGAQWPAQEEHRVEVTQRQARVCARCIRGLGFSKEIAAPGNYTLTIRE